MGASTPAEMSLVPQHVEIIVTSTDWLFPVAAAGG